MIVIGRGRVEKLWMFGRLNNFGEQVIIFAVRANVEEAVVAVPLPLKHGGRAGFIDISDYEDLFFVLDRCWDPSLVISHNPRLQAELEGSLIGAAASTQASSILTRAELAKHEPKLPPGLYPDSAFAAVRLPRGTGDVKPVAVVFQSRVSDKIYFPVAEPLAGERVRMDHRLYAQAWTGKKLEGWFESDAVTGEHVDVARAKRLVQGELRVYRTELRGERANEDVWAKLG